MSNRPEDAGTKIVLTKAVTRKKGDDYEKTIVSIESDLPKGITVPEGLITLESSIDKFLAGQVSHTQAVPIALPATTTPSSPATNLDKIDWKPFKTGRAGGWIYADRPEAKDLVNRLKATEGKKLTEGTWLYRLSGDGDRFLQRFPHKE